MYPTEPDEDDLTEVECWNCERKTTTANQWMTCVCDCSQGLRNAPVRFQGSYDPEFAATALHP